MPQQFEYIQDIDFLFESNDQVSLRVICTQPADKAISQAAEKGESKYAAEVIVGGVKVVLPGVFDTASAAARPGFDYVRKHVAKHGLVVSGCSHPAGSALIPEPQVDLLLVQHGCAHSMRFEWLSR